MGKAFLVYLPHDLYGQAKEFSQREGPPMSFLIREGLKLALEKRRHKPDGRGMEGSAPKEMATT